MKDIKCSISIQLPNVNPSEKNSWIFRFPRTFFLFAVRNALIVQNIYICAIAILVPIFAQARGKAGQAACTSNFKQQALGIMMYQQDCNETMPPAQTLGTYQAPSDTL